MARNASSSPASGAGNPDDRQAARPRWHDGRQAGDLAAILWTEMRGGTANCNVIISDAVIGAPS